SSSKSFLPEFISSLLGIKGTSLNKIEEFQKANIDLKTIRLEPNGKPREHMSFKILILMKLLIPNLNIYGSMTILNQQNFFLLSLNTKKQKVKIKIESFILTV